MDPMIFFLDMGRWVVYSREGGVSGGYYRWEVLVTPSSSSKLLPLVFVFQLVYQLRKYLSFFFIDFEVSVT